MTDLIDISICSPWLWDHTCYTSNSNLMFLLHLQDLFTLVHYIHIDDKYYNNLYRHAEYQVLFPMPTNIWLVSYFTTTITSRFFGWNTSLGVFLFIVGFKYFASKYFPFSYVSIPSNPRLIVLVVFLWSYSFSSSFLVLSLDFISHSFSSLVFFSSSSSWWTFSSNYLASSFTTSNCSATSWHYFLVWFIGVLPS